MWFYTQRNTNTVSIVKPKWLRSTSVIHKVQHLAKHQIFKTHTTMSHSQKLWGMPELLTKRDAKYFPYRNGI